MKLCPKCQKQFSDDANFCPVDAARLIPLDSAAPAGAAGTDTLAARYELGDKIGGHRTGSVYRARDKQSGAAVAVKVVAPAVVNLSGVAQRLERELKQLERVQSAGVAKLLASGKRPGAGGGSGPTEEWWIATELLDGAQTLAEAIAARGPIPLDQAAHLVEVIGEALIEAAQVGVVHRDLAPKNVLFASSGGAAEIKLVNFSLPVPTSDKVPGVPEFVAPEQVDGKAVDQRSNLYNLGAIYYYALTGQTVHAGPPEEVHRAHVNAAIRTPSSLAPVPSNVEAVIMRALDRSPTKRFLTVRQFVDEVSRIARGETDAKSTQPMGAVKAAGGKPKAELVATLLGVNKGPQGPDAAPDLLRTMIGVSSGTQAPAPVAPAPPAPDAAPSDAGHAALTAQPIPFSAQVPQAPLVPQAMPVAAVAPVQVAPPTDALELPTNKQVAVEPPTNKQAAIEPPTTQQPAITPGGDSRSPWAAPAAQQPVAVQNSSMQTTPATPAAPVVAAPVIAAPVVAASPAASGSKGKDKGAGGKKDAFRETMWFKKGDLDAQAAVAAAEERARTGKDSANDKADSLAIDERYGDDGSISRGDKEKYSLRTGATQMMSAIKDPSTASQSIGKVSEDALIGEMKSGRGKILAAIAIGGVLLILIVVMLLRH